MNPTRRRRRDGAEASSVNAMRVLLTAEAARHEPDRERILAAVERGRRVAAPVPGRPGFRRSAPRRSGSPRPGFQTRSGRGRPPLLAAAAATAAVLLLGAWTGWSALLDADRSEVTVVGNPAAGGVPVPGDAAAPDASSPVPSPTRFVPSSGMPSSSAARSGTTRPVAGPGSPPAPESAPVQSGAGISAPAGQAGPAGAQAPAGAPRAAPGPPGDAATPGIVGAPAATNATSPAPTRAPGTSSPPRAGGPTGAAPAAVPALSVTPVGAGAALSLPGSGDLDWLVVGARRDGTVIRAKRSTGAIAVPVGVGAAPVVETGPFTVSWTAGAPEQDHQGATTWWAVPASAVLRVEVTPAGGREVRVNLGTVNARGTVSARLTDGPEASLPLPSGGAAVTIRVPPTSGTQRLVIELSGVPAGADPRLGLSAVAVR